MTKEDKTNSGLPKKGPGRPKGSKNKRTLVENIVLGKMGDDYSPLITLAEIAHNKKVAPTVRVAAAGKLADFMYSRKGVEAPQQASQSVSIAINLDGSGPAPVTIDATIDTDEPDEG